MLGLPVTIWRIAHSFIWSETVSIRRLLFDRLDAQQFEGSREHRLPVALFAWVERCPVNGSGNNRYEIYMNSTDNKRLGSMTAGERRAAVGLAAIFGSRMLGLFIILPVFVVYADQLAGSSPLLIGLAIGAYGLSQAILQIPFGLASDRFGRRPVIAAGLVLFIIGSIVAALSPHIYGVILGRVVQGSGAISAAVMALAADLTRDSQRTKIMAVIGISVGGAFMVALVLGPVVAAWGGLSGVFWTTALLALLALVLLITLVPRSDVAMTDAARVGFAEVLRNPDLLRLSGGIFVLHLILTAGFVVLPVLLRDYLDIGRAAHWKVYLPVLLLSIPAMVPVIAFGERRRKMHRVVPAVVLALALVELVLAFGLHSKVIILLALCAYFSAFNILEASLPSLVSRVAPARMKGAALGVYATAQFLGAFVGGVLGGALYGRFGIFAVFLMGALMALVWVAFSLGQNMPAPDGVERVI
jgi:predicted MFS family arabinose efflux permease